MNAGKKLLLFSNWKSNGSINFVKEFSNNLLNKLSFNQDKVEIVIAPSFIHIASAKTFVVPTITMGAQNVSHFPNGAYTGEVSAEMIKDFGINWVLVGHSERRNYFRETAEILSAKISMCHEKDLKVLYCVGEKQEEKDAEKTWEVIEKQLNEIKASIKVWDCIAIAYEPIWLFGTSKTITPEEIQGIHEQIRTWINTELGEDTGYMVRIVYAGPINDTNWNDILSQTDVDGFVVGSQYLSKQFEEIVKLFNDIEK